MEEVKDGTTKFERWVKEYGVAKLVKDLADLGPYYAATFSAVYQWLRGETEPRAAKIRGLVNLSGGKITLQDVHDHMDAARAGRIAREALERRAAGARA